MNAFLFRVKYFVVVFNEVAGEVPVERCVEPLRHDVGYVLLRGNVFDCEAAVFLDLVSDPVVLYVHVP